MPPRDPRFFTQDWTITLPSHAEPTLEFMRLTPTNMDTWIKILPTMRDVTVKAPPMTNTNAKAPNPNNNEPSNDDDAAMKTQALNRYQESRTKHNVLVTVISLHNQILGSGNIVVITDPGVRPSIANIGIRLTPDARGKGLGKVLMRVLLRLSCEFEVDVVEAGTMKGNVAMRALARSLALVETDEVKEVPGRGVVADLMFKDIDLERWRGLEWCVDFREPEEAVASCC